VAADPVALSPVAADEFATLTEGLEGELGGRVVRIERQARWRPAWWVDLERDGEVLELCVRGERLDSPSAFSLDHERVFQTLLSERGIRVAAVYGHRDSGPKAYVMDRVPGRDNFAGESDVDRLSAMEDYVDILFDMHQLDVTPFAEAGIVRAERPQESHLVGLRHFVERAYRSEKKRPDPFLEFALAWLDRNEPANPGREAVIVWDAGQFHQKDGRITAMLDLEFGHIGDPLADLAGLWVRNPFIPFGDVAALMRRYQDRSGTPLDLGAIRWHYILWAMSNQLEFHAVLADPVPGADYMLNLHWCIESNLMALEAMAAAGGVEFGPMVEEPAPAESGYGPAHGHLTRSLENLPSTDSVARYELRKSVRLARHVQRIDEIGTQVVAEDLIEITKLTGRHCATWAEGEADLERFVLGDDGRHDEELMVLFHRRLHRARLLNGPAGSWITQHREVAQPSL
jgi:aminoglycoside phosphotransferase (APT) family kinase protein